MKLLGVLILLVCATPAFAQPSAPKQWGSVGAATRFSATGLTLSYGQQDFFAPGTDARFGAGYFSDPYSGGFAAELFADALAYTYDPLPESGLALVAYGGLGPRLLVQTDVYSYVYEDPDGVTAYLLSVGGLGGLETRLGSFGVFLELEVSLPAFGLIGPQFRAFPFEAGLGSRLNLGTNYYF